MFYVVQMVELQHKKIKETFWLKLRKSFINTPKPIVEGAAS